MTFKLNKSLYGVKQVQDSSTERFSSFMIDHEYDRTTSYHYIDVKCFLNDNFIIFLLYMNNMLIVSHVLRKLQISKKRVEQDICYERLVSN